MGLKGNIFQEKLSKTGYHIKHKDNERLGGEKGLGKDLYTVR